MDKRTFLIALNLVPHIESRAMFALLDKINSLDDIGKIGKTELRFSLKIGPAMAETILLFPFAERLDKELETAEKKNITIITRLDDQYPEQLLNIYSPPAVLYIRGNIELDLDSTLAVVGTRKLTPYGKQVTERLVKELAESGVTIISGLAHGVDRIAHQTALDANGVTIAVLGCGVDIIYPSKHKDLFHSIIKSGGVVSEFPLGTSPVASNFPIRNRIISGLSYGTLIIEAAEKSGSLITAKYALEQGRDVFAVPGSITSRQSIGTNYLIKCGAKLVQRADDILSEMKYERKSLSENIQKKIEIKSSFEKDLDDIDREILSHLEFDKPSHIDIVCSLINEDPKIVWQHLLELELKDAVVQLEGKMFIKKY